MRVLISAGERSGFSLAELLSQELQRQYPGVAVKVFDISPGLGQTLGIWEGLQKSLMARGVWRYACAEVMAWQPDVVVLIAFPGVHLILGQRLRQKGVKVCYLAPPQVWAWGGWRVRLLRSAADRVIALFPFEEKVLRSAGVNVAYHGYPFLDAVVVSRSREEVLGGIGLRSDAEYIAFLPGSRPGEISFHQPLFTRVFQRLQRWYPGIAGVIVGGEAGLLPTGMYRVTSDRRYDVIKYARLAAVVSGTATAETAILGTPMVVLYHLAQPGRFLARLFVRVRFFGLPNLVLNRPVVPELLEPDEAILNRIIIRLLRDSGYQEVMKKGLRVVRERLGPSGALVRIAADIFCLGLGKAGGR